MKLVTFNIQFGRGRDGLIELARMADVVREADIICLQEVDRHWRRTGMADQVAEIMALFPDRYVVFGAGLDVDASHRADGVVVNRRRQFGNATLSRWPILSSRAIVLPKIGKGEEMNTWTVALETVIDAPGGAMRVINLHLSHVDAEERCLQVEALRKLVLDAAVEGGAWSGVDADYELWQCGDAAPPMPVPVILAGDFNAEPHSTELQILTSDGDDGFGLVDGWRAATCPGDSGVTFFADAHQGAFHDQRIDYLLLSPVLVERLTKAWTDTVTGASDHQPVWLTLHPAG